MPLHYDPSRCQHPVPQGHITGRTAKGRAVWRCSACGTEGAWATGWRYFGTVECKWCWLPVVERVTCPACSSPEDVT